MNPLTVPVALLYFVLASLAASQAHGNTTVSKPNILFIFTDDQDLELGSLNYLPEIRERIQDQGKVPRPRIPPDTNTSRVHIQQSLRYSGVMLPIASGFITRSACSQY